MRLSARGCQAIQISRDLGAVFKNVVMFAGTGLILGALYKDMLLDWPSSVSPMCNQGKIDCADDDEVIWGREREREREATVLAFLKT